MHQHCFSGSIPSLLYIFRLMHYSDFVFRYSEMKQLKTAFIYNPIRVVLVAFNIKAVSISIFSFELDDEFFQLISIFYWLVSHTDNILRIKLSGFFIAFSVLNILKYRLSNPQLQSCAVRRLNAPSCDKWNIERMRLNVPRIFSGVRVKQ